jgi:hypothetical protein
MKHAVIAAPKPQRRLTPREIGVVKLVHRHQNAGLKFVALGKGLRGVALTLWRENYIELWWKQVPELEPNMFGPFFGLSARGQRVALSLTQRGRHHDQLQHTGANYESASV